ncbi:long-chain-fatty-acid--CoA ligase [Mycobacterium tuberculosis]|nr:long-chain-fatty-acid--CoA ligase [Mycobacterium tuberculosis]
MRIRQAFGLIATMRRAGLIAPLRPDRYLRIVAAMAAKAWGLRRGSPVRPDAARTAPA